VYNYDPLPDDFFEGFSNPDQMRETMQLMDRAIDRRLRIAYGGRSAAATRNPYRHTPYGMPTTSNKNTLRAARERYRAVVSSNPKWQCNEWNVSIQ
jgi:hypothetical protein